MLAEKPDVSIVILEYLSLDEVDICLNSLTDSLDSIRYEIIVSSNSCYYQNEQKFISDKYKGVKWIFNEKNGGFAYGMNNGLSKANGRYLVIANADIKILGGFQKMIAFMDSHPEVGAIGPQMVDVSGIIQDNCRYYVNVPRFLIRHFRRLLSREAAIRNKSFNYSIIQTVDWLAGAFIMVRDKAYEITWGLDETYFMYAEDLDWCTRIRESGYEVVYYPYMRIVYKGSRHARKFNKYSCIFIKSHLKYWSKFGFFFGYPARKHMIYE